MDKKDKNGEAAPPKAASKAAEAEGWERHRRAERAKTGIALGAVALCAAVAGALMFGAKAPAPKAAPPLSVHVQALQKARAVEASPEAELSGRVAPAARVLGDRGAAQAPPKQELMPSAGVRLSKAAASAPVAKAVSASTVPTAQMMAAAGPGKEGKPRLAVGADGFATLPDGRKVKTQPARPASPQSAGEAQAKLAAAQAQARAAEAARGAFFAAEAVRDKNANPIPMSMEQSQRGLAEFEANRAGPAKR